MKYIFNNTNMIHFVFKDDRFSASENKDWILNFSFVQAADTQLGFMSLLGDRDKVHYKLKLLIRYVQFVYLKLL